MALTCPQLCPQCRPDFNGLSRAMLDTTITVCIDFKGFVGLSQMVLEKAELKSQHKILILKRFNYNTQKYAPFCAPSRFVATVLITD